MFIGIPLTLIGISVAAISFIVVRKFSYLQKLTPEVHVGGQSMVEELFPEFLGLVRKVDLKRFNRSVLAEAEKLLRKIRLLVLAVERVSDSLIHRIRHVQRQSVVSAQEKEAIQEPQKEVVLLDVQEPAVKTETGVSNIHKKEKVSEGAPNTELKSEEQRLIVAIAQNHKDSNLYGALGEVYMKMGNWQDAKESFQAALKLKPADRDMAQKFSLVLQKLLEK